ncbi:CocE/NonD family hydrolase [Roseovarius atlanticus]|uniref:CocE/NonD family hydrolase n=1 Tax=Roseovarius atlanticus TaxID=1641875 RepID=UPI001C98256A|nr:CocE/NonD family hydrolase [Roseovarius atlanticus]MBY5990342.1 CocE/NonD family hydrolase [Roseovarius atlanticus]MBY6126888.1 CocE/NonD family hydrolase [Roseovarius atlanticus]MBY6151381.1 CocE/NonD family hydrolase [Roseovarius atlanticus]
MKIDHPLPQTIQEIEHLEIPMPDGTRLAARIWMPEGSEDLPVPAILEFIPYRKNDKTLERDHARAPWMAAQGYAYVRVDLRGTGESEGLMTDEYTDIELQDGCDVIAWIAGQDWCDGGVGIVGISWGGFNGLQLAALRPPALKAVVTICSTDDRYADDIHYMGGTLLGDHLSWASVMFGINTLPPDPAHVGDRWRTMWEERLDGSGLWLKNWMQHQRRDAFWKHGSVCENFSDIEVPVYAVSGWADGYCRAVFRLVENLEAPVKGLVGPWSHRYPHLGEPGPAIDWLTEETRWWDQWLKGQDTGIADEPKLRVFLQDHAKPQTHYEERSGHWIDLASWPSAQITRTSFALSSDGGLGRAGPGEPLKLCSPLWVGRHGGKWCSYGHPGDQPGDQRREDAGSLTFETAPLEDDRHMVGDPTFSMTFQVDRPVAQVAARLMDVAPDGAATRVSYGLLNLTHRDSHEHPETLEPGQTYTVTVPMKHVAQTFRAGHRIRLGLSTSYFPIAWPAPEPVTLTVLTGECRLDLPLCNAAPVPVESFGPARAAEPLELEVERASSASWSISEDADTGRLLIEVVDDEGAATIRRQGFFHAAKAAERYTILPDDPTSAEGEVTWTHEMRRDEWMVRTVTWTKLTADKSEYRIEARLQAFLDDTCVRDLDWDVRVPRDHN